MVVLCIYFGDYILYFFISDDLKSTNDLTVTAGEHNRTVKEDEEQTLKVREIFVHPEFISQNFYNVRPGIPRHTVTKNDVGKIL